MVLALLSSSTLLCSSSILTLVTTSRVSGGRDLVVERVERLSLGAVHVEPPVADEVRLVEEGAVGTEERVLAQTRSSVAGADVERLALRLRVRVVSTVHLAVAGERGLRRLRVDGVVFAWGSRYVLLKSISSPRTPETIVLTLTKSSVIPKSSSKVRVAPKSTSILL